MRRLLDYEDEDPTEKDAEPLRRRRMRKAKILLAVLLFTFASEAWAECPPGPMFGFASEEIDVSTTAKGFTSTIAYPAGQQPADMAVCFVEDDAVRWLDSGLNPTASAGLIFAVSSYFTVCNEASIKRFRMIRQTTDADVTCNYYRSGNQ